MVIRHHGGDMEREAGIASRPARPTEVAAGIRHASRRVLGRHPALFLPVAFRRHPQSALNANTDLVIDGFGRSAVTFAVIAFQVAQNGHVHVAHHAHAIAPILAAAKRGVPELVTIREPEATVLSSVVREPGVPMHQFLRSYVDFYRRLGDVADDVVLARFESITEDFGAVIGRVNQRFGTSFEEFDHTAERAALVFDLIEERASRPPWQRLLGEFLCGNLSFDEYMRLTQRARAERAGSNVPETLVQRPSDARESMKAAARSRYRAPSLTAWRDRAVASYRALSPAAV
jgi:hypothetical protein